MATSLRAQAPREVVGEYERTVIMQAEDRCRDRRKGLPTGARRRPDAPSDIVMPLPRMGARPIADRDFKALRDLIHRMSGIHLTPEKRTLLVGRLNRRLRALGLASFREYLDFLENGGNAAEAVHMLDCICTNETHFFREPQQFEFLERAVYPAWAADASRRERARHIKVWSAACSTGEEPYSIAMSLLAHFPAQAGWTIDVLATDLSTSALAKAVAAEWPIEKAAEIPAQWLKRFMLQGTGRKEGLMAAGPDLRSAVRFQRLNLVGKVYPSERDFDLVFCRNVIIYFDPRTKAEVVVRLLEYLAPHGYLLLGHAESIHGIDSRAQRHIPAVYSLRSSPEPKSGEKLPSGGYEAGSKPR